MTAGACVEGSAAEGGETLCFGDDETDSQSGAGDGCPFLPGCEEGEDEGPTVKLDTPDWGLECEPECAPPWDPGFPEDPKPPPGWAHDSTTGSFYRLASETERAVHGWPEGTALLSASAVVDGLINGRSTSMILALPVPVQGPRGVELELAYEKLVRRRSRSDVWHVSASADKQGELVSRAFKPEFHIFLPTWLELRALSRGVPEGVDSFVVAYGDSHGGVVMQALMPAEELLISGPSSKLWLELPPPGGERVLVSRPVPHAAGPEELLPHWMELALEICGDTGCAWEPELGPEDTTNCRDCVDNDGDGRMDGGDLGCVHRSDFGCGGFGPHAHWREDVKDFAEMPDVQWCTRMLEDGMPWHTELYAQASEAAMLLNALEAAATLHPDYSPPEHVPSVRYRFAYCVFAESEEAAEECVGSGVGCPPGYSMGGVGGTIRNGEPESRDYFRRMWGEYDTAMHALEAEGITPKPVAMLSGVYSGNLVEVGAIGDDIVGLASNIGDLNADVAIGGIGATTLEAEFVYAVVIAHELGHALGLSHTLTDDYYGFNGFMRPAYPQPAFAVLGPSLNLTDGYRAHNQWSNWFAKIGDKGIPRPNAFGLSGCDNHDECPSPLECWSAGTLGLVACAVFSEVHHGQVQYKPTNYASPHTLGRPRVELRPWRNCARLRLRRRTTRSPRGSRVV